MEIVQCELITLITILIELLNDYLHDIDTIMRYKCTIGKMEYYIYIHWYDSRMDLATLVYKSDIRGGGMFVVWICLFYLYIT